MIITVLRNDHILIKNAVKIVKSSNVSVFEKKTAKAMKNCSISIFNKKMTFIFDEQVAETLKIDKFFNFHCL